MKLKAVYQEKDAFSIGIPIKSLEIENGPVTPILRVFWPIMHQPSAMLITGIKRFCNDRVADFVAKKDLELRVLKRPTWRIRDIGRFESCPSSLYMVDPITVCKMSIDFLVPASRQRSMKRSRAFGNLYSIQKKMLCGT